MQTYSFAFFSEGIVPTRLLLNGSDYSLLDIFQNTMAALSIIRYSLY